MKVFCRPKKVSR